MKENSVISPDMKKVEAEKKRLLKLFEDIEPTKRQTILGLIDRAAFMSESLRCLELDINENGFTEWFKQGKEDPYQRQRPSATIYGTMNTSFQKIIKQLTDLLPKEDSSRKADSDGFEDFVIGRDDS